jgi:hypothetical protein
MSIILGLSVFFADKKGILSDKEIDKIEKRKEKIKSIIDN